MDPEVKAKDSGHLRLVPDASGTGQADEAGGSETVHDLKLAVAELRVADEELRQQNEELAVAHLQIDAERRRYRELFDLAPDAYLVTNLAGIITDANRSASSLLGVSLQFL